MKVLHVIPSVSTVHGGPSEAMKVFELACVAAGVNMETLTTDDDGPGKRNGLADGATQISDGVIHRYFRKTTDTYKISISLARWLFRNVAKYDIIHIHALFSFTSTAAALIARYRKVPYIIRPLGTLNQYGLENRRAFPKRLSMWLLEKRILRNAACIHCTSHNEKQQLEQLKLSLEIVVLPLATDISASHNASLLLNKFPELLGKRWLVFMSRLDPVKNIELLFAALKYASAHWPDDVVLLLAGEGNAEYEKSLVKISDTLAISNRIIWAGHLQENLKVAALCGAELFIMPSRSENFGIAAVEAMSLGVPCILSKGVAIADAAGKANAAIVIGGNDADEMSAQILRLLDDGNLRKQLSEQAASFASAHFSVGVMGNNLNQLYNGVIAQTKSAGAIA